MENAQLRLWIQTTEGIRRSIDFSDLDRTAALRHAASRGWQVMSIESKEPAGTVGRRRGHGFDLMLFNHELLALLEAGLNLSEALDTLCAKGRESAAGELLASMLASLEEGKSFSDVLSDWPEHFPEIYVATARAAERSGGLSEALRRYLDYQMQFEVIRKKVVAAAIYPALLLVVGGLVTLFLLGYVVPRFSVIYESSGRSLPFLSALLLRIGGAIYQHWGISLAIAAGGTGTLIALLSRPSGRAWVFERVLRLPWLARRADDFRLARFYRATSLLLSAGIALPRALGMVTGLLSSEQQRRLSAARLSVEQGQMLSSSLVAAGLATVVAESLIRVGERSGQLPEMLARTARFQDESFARWIDWFSRLLEPVLMAIIGLIVGGVVVLMYVPIFDLAGSLQ